MLQPPAKTQMPRLKMETRLSSCNNSLNEDYYNNLFHDDMA